MKHFASSEFWAAYEKLPTSVRELADKHYELLKADPAHPSLRFKTVGRFRSVRIGLRYRALGIDVDNGVLWFCIGMHAEYDRTIP